jgi:hypothetical protein
MDIKKVKSPPSDAASLHLDIADDGQQIKLLVRHPEIGLVCELWCYEGGPFRYGTAVKRDDGSVAFVHKSGQMTATTTFIPKEVGRVAMNVLIAGPLEELKQVKFVGPCMQFWHSEAFKRRDTLVEFARRCFLYTLRGPVGMLDSARGLQSGFPPEAPENNPPCTQWYVPIGATHPGDIWAFGASGDRPIHNIVAVTSQDDRWLAAVGCARARTLGQGWHDCIHHVADMQTYLEEYAGQIRHRSMIYVMPNDRRWLLQSYLKDFPVRIGVDAPDDTPFRADSHPTVVSAGRNGTLQVAPSGVPHAPRLLAKLGLCSADGRSQIGRSPAWKVSPWGGFVRSGDRWRMWAFPNGEVVEICVSVSRGAEPASVDVTLLGDGWTTERPPEGIPALVRRSPDGAWIAAWIWEQSAADQLAQGILAPGSDGAESVTARGRLYLFQGDVEALRGRWITGKTEWEHAVPYRMPVSEPADPAPVSGVRFAPDARDAEEPKAYGLTILPPWKDGGALYANFPEHFEHGDVGYGILRYSDKRANAWKIAPDGRAAHYEVESPELPGVIVRATAVAEGDHARLTLKVTNGGEKTLERVKPLLCFWYAGLAGFPDKLSDNFHFTYVVMDGKPVALSSIPTDNPDATAKVAYVRGCSQHDCDKFAQSRGGLIAHDIDLAVIAVTARDGKHKVILAFTPGKSILSNAFIPCAHADPYVGTIKPSESREVEGLIVFTDAPLDKAVRTLRRAGVGAPKE